MMSGIGSDEMAMKWLSKPLYVAYAYNRFGGDTRDNEKHEICDSHRNQPIVLPDSARWMIHAARFSFFTKGQIRSLSWRISSASLYFSILLWLEINHCSGHRGAQRTRTLYAWVQRLSTRVQKKAVKCLYCFREASQAFRRSAHYASTGGLRENVSRSSVKISVRSLYAV